MKKLAFVTMILFTMWINSVDAQMVSVVERIQSNPSYDSVWVIYPNGVVEKYEVPDYFAESMFKIEHFVVMSNIYNGVINQGYKLFSVEEVSTSFTVSYFLKPWTPSSSELEQAKDLHLSIKGYPNPTDGIITIEIEFTKGYKPTELAIINEAGYIVQVEQIQVKSGERVTIDLSGQKAGLYLITAKNAKQYSALFKCILN